MEAKRIASLLRRSYEGIAWHGPALKELLDGVTAERAASKPLPGAHSIWEIVLHVEAWQREALLALEGKPYESMTGDADRPPVRETTPQAWQATLEKLAATARKLMAAVRSMDDAQLDELVAGKEFSYYFMLHGVTQHNLYHAGQIALLRK